TDSDNYIIDLHLKHIEDPHALASELISLVGVVEHGLFLDIADYVIVGTQTGIKRMTRDGESFDQLK
ncbi:ribose-5-phosphate isomerase A, partial [Paucilactobacillus nenjiangensis]